MVALDANQYFTNFLIDDLFTAHQVHSSGERLQLQVFSDLT
jgi:hypothetical protein